MKRLFYGFLAAFLMILPLTGLFAQDRGLSVVAAENLGSSTAIGKQYALFIAIDAYRTWPALKKPVTDAREIRSILEKDYFIDEIIELYNQNATKEKIVETFENLQEKLGVHDSLFIYYAGHGHLDNASKQGYWIPVDGGTNQRTKENWLPNSEIRGYISGFKTIHVFMVSDSCFSGDILNTNRSFQPQIDNAYYRKAYGLTSRQVLTSGSSEKVPDQSEFSEAIKNCLRKNTAPLLDPLGIYNDVRLGVQSTTPLYGTLNASNHQEGATFLFFRKQTAQPIAPATVQPTAPTPQQPSVTGGSVTVESEIAGEIFIDGQATGRRIKAGGTETISNVSTGSTEVWVKDSDGATVKAPTVMVRQGQTVSVVIERPIPEGLAFEIVGGKSVTITKYSGTATTVHIPEKIHGLPVTVIRENAFFDGDYLTSITVDSRNSAFTGIDGVLFDKNIKSLILCPRGKKGTYSIPSSVTTIRDFAFNACTNLTSISIPSSVTSIGDRVFSYCNNLNNISIPFSVTSIGNYAFLNCYSLTSITIPSSVTSIGAYAFYYCNSFTSITIPSSVTSIGAKAFDLCSKLTSVTLSRKTQVGKDAFPASAKITYSD